MELGDPATPVMTSTFIGAKNFQQLNDNIASANLELTTEALQKLNHANALTHEYPGWMVTRKSAGRWPD